MSGSPVQRVNVIKNNVINIIHSRRHEKCITATSRTVWIWLEPLTLKDTRDHTDNINMLLVPITTFQFRYRLQHIFSIISKILVWSHYNCLLITGPIVIIITMITIKGRRQKRRFIQARFVVFNFNR